ncbi:MAG: hypothetical protein M1839_007916 [Geoglossum umbratile]|nr:MAG: hypothetical protein M1839_007916 [Geoglossum umbratile]
MQRFAHRERILCGLATLNRIYTLDLPQLGVKSRTIARLVESGGDSYGNEEDEDQEESGEDKDKSKGKDDDEFTDEGEDEGYKESNDNFGEAYPVQSGLPLLDTF